MSNPQSPRELESRRSFLATGLAATTPLLVPGLGSAALLNINNAVKPATPESVVGCHVPGSIKYSKRSRPFISK